MRLLSQLSHGDGVSHHVFQKRYSLPPQPYPPAPPSSGNKISPALLFVIVILAALFFVAGLLHLLFRFLLKKPRPPPPSSSQRRRAADLSGPDALQRQLQQLFHLHDHGLDQALIDALPVFLYADVVGSAAEPFDCAVCLCEFDAGDELRLLPACGHAFHLCCIDTWLLSNSTCPLCRGNPALDPAASAAAAAAGDEEAATAAEADEEEVFPVRLGKFKNVEDGNGNGKADSFEGNGIGTGDVRLELGESSSGSLGARRCFSMGSYQYVEAGATLQVAFKHCSAARNGDGRGIKGREASAAAAEGKRLGIGGRRESFSVSKIWLWTNKKGKVVVPPNISALGIQLPWKEIGAGDARNLSMI